MLKTRVITAIILLAVLLPIFYTGHLLAFTIATSVFFVAASWETFRLFAFKRPVVWAALCSVAFIGLIFAVSIPERSLQSVFLVCVLVWCLRFIPALKLGLPEVTSPVNRLLGIIYMMAVFGCFLAIDFLFRVSPMYLLSVMLIVWAADIGAYFVGKGFGRHKLAPAISPGKSWEGAIGGWMTVMVVTAMLAMYPEIGETFPANVQLRFGVMGFVGLMSLLVIASIIGDLFESQLKRRVGMKDSSQLLPGHGGVLDRIDALIPVLPLAALIHLYL